MVFHGDVLPLGSKGVDCCRLIFFFRERWLGQCQYLQVKSQVTKEVEEGRCARSEASKTNEKGFDSGLPVPLLSAVAFSLCKILAPTQLLVCARATKNILMTLVCTS